MSVLVGKQAPDFTVSAVMPDNTINDNFNFKQYTNGKITVLFFWPADFTFVCPTEIIAFNNKLKEFEDRGVVVIGASIDSAYVHYTWKSTAVDNGGIGNVQFPMIADLGGDISKTYDVLSEGKIAFRATFIIDQNGKVVHELINDLPLGRSIDETLRTIDALLFVQKNGEVCPANWNKGKEGIKASSKGVADFLSKHANEL
mgnify:CR=1 FL=1